MKFLPEEQCVWAPHWVPHLRGPVLGRVVPIKSYFENQQEILSERDEGQWEIKMVFLKAYAQTHLLQAPATCSSSRIAWVIWGRIKLTNFRSSARRAGISGNSLWWQKHWPAPLFLHFICCAFLHLANLEQAGAKPPLTWLTLFALHWCSPEIPPHPTCSPC